MSELRWQLDGLAFDVLLEAVGRDRWPYPLSFLPPFMECHDDWEYARKLAAERVQGVFDERLYRAMVVLLEPQVRIEIHGFHGPQLSQVVRIHAGIVDRDAVVAVQQPGPDPQHGRDVVLTMGSARLLPSEIVAKLPRCQGGSHPPFGARRSDLAETDYTGYSMRPSPGQQLNRFFRRPRTSLGEITVYPSIAYDARPTKDGQAFHWLDYPDDGRYLLVNHNDDDLSVTPGATDELLRQLQYRIEACQRSRTNAW
ncbi:ESX secretion-associated protein EspG [Nocardia sp. XZ_19_385]|uniref:ESX secretion-associated protein EspG n=1 Tax=Nocardia sp. XZ_19_385 TaxID=2769488 RepID=UPI00188DD441|nr:ESX secretion-associated protein EspG [Nocardia sp. XZ_19_385]